MKIHRLRAHNFRGIRDLDLDLGGKSLVILGPNGTGKSSILDAIDFLCTGSIRRLTGEGTKAISIAKHAAHVDEGAQDAWVEADFETSAGESKTLRRTIREPDELIYEESLPHEIYRYLEQCAQGSHLLTRREILRYIVTEPSQRYQQISSLLEITQLDSVRKELQGAAKLAKERFQQAAAVVTARQGSVLRSFNPQASDFSDVRRLANLHRAALGAPALERIQDGSVLSSITSPSTSSPGTLQTQRVRELLLQVATWLSDAEAVGARASAYATAVSALRADRDRMRTLALADLLRRGERLIDDDRCPLCEMPQDAAQLRTEVLRRLSEAEQVQQLLQELEIERQDCRNLLAGAEAEVRSLATAMEHEFTAEARALEAYADALRFYAGTLLVEPMAGDLADPAIVESAVPQFRGDAVGAQVAELRARSGQLPDLSGIQKAWDELSGLDRALGELREALAAQVAAKKVLTALEPMEAIFVEARDAVMEETYEGISARFASLYRKLHRTDEDEFEATLEPTKAGLKLEVEFFGRGTHPPSALHSEGHQDSMGICLFLALSERTGEQPIPIVMLDDVVMSVDHGHRRAVAELLRDEYPEIQLIITTHDRVWWRQLQNVGAVDRKQCLEIRHWSLEDGPAFTENASEMLAAARAALHDGNVPTAAHQLRRAIEVHFRDVCDCLGAAVRFRGDGAYQAGDFVLPANRRIAELIRTARKAGESWGKPSVNLDEWDTRRATASRHFSEENWAVNHVVHYNEWVDLGIGDFAPVLAAYEELFTVFSCNTCKTLVWVEEQGATPAFLRCACGDVAFNLLKKVDGVAVA